MREPIESLPPSIPRTSAARSGSSRVAIGAAVVLAAVSVIGAAQQRAPAPPMAIESLAGRDNFEMYCASCHGVDARGTGPVAGSLNTPPADLTSLARRNGGAFPREDIRAFVTGSGPRPVGAHGSSAMPVWGPIFSALDASAARTRQRLDNIVRYLESIQAPSTGASDPGSQLFRTYCASCHGADARGSGPMAAQLRRVPPDLTQFTARNGGVFPSERVYRIIDGRDVAAHGDREMPVWGDAFRRTGAATESAVAARIEAIVRYLQGIQARSALLGEPSVWPRLAVAHEPDGERSPATGH